MDTIKNNKSVKVIKESDSNEVKEFDFLSFNKDRSLSSKVISLEKAIEIKNKQLERLKQDFDKKQLEQEVAFHDRLDKCKQESYDKGFADGHLKGNEDGQKIVLKSNEYLKDCAQKVLKEKEQILLNQEETLFLMIKKICEKILNTEITESNEIMLAIIKKSLSLINDRANLQLRLSSKDLNIVEKNLDKIKALYLDIKNIDLIIDERVSQGGLIIDSSGGSLDSRFEIQLENIYQALLAKSREK